VADAVQDRVEGNEPASAKLRGERLSTNHGYEIVLVTKSTVAAVGCGEGPLSQFAVHLKLFDDPPARPACRTLQAGNW
jgi:hypothetical protein